MEQCSRLNYSVDESMWWKWRRDISHTVITTWNRNLNGPANQHLHHTCALYFYTCSMRRWLKNTDKSPITAYIFKGICCVCIFRLTAECSIKLHSSTLFFLYLLTFLQVSVYRGENDISPPQLACVKIVICRCWVDTGLLTPAQLTSLGNVHVHFM